MSSVLNAKNDEEDGKYERMREVENLRTSIKDVDEILNRIEILEVSLSIKP